MKRTTCCSRPTTALQGSRGEEGNGSLQHYWTISDTDVLVVIINLSRCSNSRLCLSSTSRIPSNCFIGWNVETNADYSHRIKKDQCKLVYV